MTKPLVIDRNTVKEWFGKETTHQLSRLERLGILPKSRFGAYHYGQLKKALDELFKAEHSNSELDDEFLKLEEKLNGTQT